MTLFQCTTKENALQNSGTCWKTFWSTTALFFILSCIGAGCLLFAILTCCCFVCAKSPGAGKKAKDQFIAGDADAAAHADQYAYGATTSGGGAAKV